MKQCTIQLPAMAEIEFSVAKTTLNATSLLNQNDAHIHTACEVYINLSGDVMFAVEKQIYDVSRGTAILTMPYEYHHCIYRSNVPHEHFWITFSTQTEQDFLRPFFKREKGMDNCINLSETALGEVCGILNSLLEQDASALEQRLLILRFFQLLSEGSVKGPTTVESNRLPRDVTDALAYMDEHLQEDLDVKNLAAVCGVSVNTMERHFKKNLNITPSEMLKRKRLFASVMYLKGGYSVTDAAQKSGFSDYSNYIQLFRKQFGVTPGKYKKGLGN